MDTKLKGRYGELLAAEYLKKKKYKIIGMGYRVRQGEIDVIAENRQYVVFAEVKLRRDDHFAEAKEFVTPAKQKRLLAAAQQWLQINDPSRQPRFDVIEVYAPLGIETKKPVIRHWENAFGADFG